jgi:hypothetical protein
MAIYLSDKMLKEKVIAITCFSPKTYFGALYTKTSLNNWNQQEISDFFGGLKSLIVTKWYVFLKYEVAKTGIAFSIWDSYADNLWKMVQVERFFCCLEKTLQNGCILLKTDYLNQGLALTPMHLLYLWWTYRVLKVQEKVICKFFNKVIFSIH